jgi:hypothetical protein
MLAGGAGTDAQEADSDLTDHSKTLGDGVAEF